MAKLRAFVASCALSLIPACTAFDRTIFPTAPEPTPEQEEQWKQAHYFAVKPVVIQIGELGGVVVPAANAGAVLHQCSRRSVTGSYRLWPPTQSDIESLEALMPDYVQTHLPVGHDKLGYRLASYKRQYLGLEREGHRFIYANLFQVSAHMEDWRSAVVVHCDGGDSYFGVFFDVSEGRIVDVAYNGWG